MNNFYKFLLFLYCDNNITKCQTNASFKEHSYTLPNNTYQPYNINFMTATIFTQKNGTPNGVP